MMKSLLEASHETEAPTPKTKSRTRNEGNLYQKRGVEGTMRQILSDPAIAPVRATSATSKKKEKKDFTKENVKRIRQIAVQRQLLMQNGGKSLAATWSASSTVGPDILNSNSITNDRTRKDFAINGQNIRPSRWSTGVSPLRSTPSNSNRPFSGPNAGRPVVSGSHSGSLLNLRTSSASADRNDLARRKNAAAQRSSSALPAVTDKKKDFIRMNSEAVKRSTIPRSTSMSAGLNEKDDSIRKSAKQPSRLGSVKLTSQPKSAQPKCKPGELPSYLLERRLEWQKVSDAAEAAAKKPKLPPGCYIMSEEERLLLLEQLQESKVKKEREMFLLPVRSDTLRAQRKRQELEAALTEIDEGLEILSKPTVVVQDQENKLKDAALDSEGKSTAEKISSKPAWNQGAVDHNKTIPPITSILKKPSAAKTVANTNVAPISNKLIHSHMKVFKRK